MIPSRPVTQLLGALTDLSPMPFGKHRNTPMQDVPASYLHWLYTEGGHGNNKQSKVGDYIRRNIEALKKEYPNGIWEPT